MRYFDTSFLVPLILSEKNSEPIGEFFKNLPTGDWTVSHWTRVEFISALARGVRMGKMNSAEAHEAGSRFEAMVEESFSVLLPSQEDFDRAKDLLSIFETGLRAGDALHLAIASNRAVDSVYS